MGMRRLAGFRADFQRNQLEAIAGIEAAIDGDQRMQVFVEDFPLLVGQFLEAGEGRVQRFLAFHDDAEFLQAGAERVAAG